jgi:hypothetical protein
MREIKVEEYLLAKVEGPIGGLCEKHTTPGRRGPPDRLVTFPNGGVMKLVELKTIGGELSAPQVRDHKRRARAGYKVPVLWTKQQVAAWLIEMLPLWYRPGLSEFVRGLRRDAGLDV